MASGIYNRFKANLMNGELDLEGDTIKVMLLDDSHTFSATDDVIGDVDANEISGAGYTATGDELIGKGVTQAATTKWDATDSDWASATFSAWHAVIYDTTAASNLIASIDLGGEQAISGGTFTIKWHSDGIITLA